MATLRSSQARVLAAVGGTDMRVSQARVLVGYNVPSPFLRASQAFVETAYQRKAVVNASAARVLVAWSGRIANPTLRAWGFSLDEHDFYVLRLGDDLSLICDLTTGEWSEYTSKDNPFWRANCGINWAGADEFAYSYGSNVLVGDDLFGTLYFLNPLQAYDDHPSPLVEEPQPFERVVTGQVVTRGHATIPCYDVYLTASFGEPLGGYESIELTISDDSGNTFWSAGSITLVDTEFVQEVVWQSLGQVQAPGRIFRVTDYGAIQRIDGMEFNDDVNNPVAE